MYDGGVGPSVGTSLGFVAVVAFKVRSIVVAIVSNLSPCACRLIANGGLLLKTVITATRTGTDPELACPSSTGSSMCPTHGIEA